MATETLTRSRITLDFQPPVARIGLHHPRLNVIDVAMMDELAQVLAEIEARSDVTTLVLSGTGKSFSVGVDISAHTPDRVAHMLSRFHSVIRALVASQKITIAAVHGHCLGGGAELAMVCDLVYTAEDASWGFPEIKLGCYPPVAATALAALVGHKHAADLILTGRTISGAAAARIGLANRAIAGAEVEPVVQETIQQLSTLSPAALAIAKKANYAWDAMHFDKGLARAERIYLEELMKTEDVHEGINAFMEKRQPVWKGK
jgi:cyclohexa-1,5-dienecarbonyl-CoA hydratase